MESGFDCGAASQTRRVSAVSVVQLSWSLLTCCAAPLQERLPISVQFAPSAVLHAKNAHGAMNLVHIIKDQIWLDGERADRALQAGRLTRHQIAQRESI